MLVKITEPFNVPSESGANATVTVCVCPLSTVNPPPGGLVTLNGPATARAAVPVNDTSPVLITEKFWLLVCPIGTDP